LTEDRFQRYQKARYTDMTKRTFKKDKSVDVPTVRLVNLVCQCCLYSSGLGKYLFVWDNVNDFGAHCFSCVCK